MHISEIVDPRLEDGIQMNLQYPETYHIPPEEMRTALLPGELAKVKLVNEVGAGEKFWIKIEERLEADDRLIYKVSAQNNLYGFEYGCGDVFYCEPRHIITI
ncbi:hypothetical protein AU106_gp223 [Sinorhizobium phage phiM9]|uniref:Uncharacterized protein n=1 Tax=Sinorhizobium phage phiM9 TaxID=1636182 RepID=A0A0F6TH82_9CAUD|nr:hypothetical protein AU106_gp223 [Sinorhizobium phage phiM9]AKE44854.1 hypothetical protein Sm_phiM9_227 [Sinorhizobium phage phiM9]